MKTPRFLTCILCLAPFALRAQTTETWKSSPSNSTFGFASNWNSGISPVSGDNLVFSSTSISSINLGIPFTANSITFSGAFPHYTFTGSGPTLSIGSSGITLAASGTSSGSSSVDFTNSLPIALTASQTWTTNGPTGGNLSVSGNVSGTGFALTKAGTGFLALSGTNTYSGGTAVNAGTLYLGNSSAGSGAITVGSAGTVGAVNSSVTINNTVSVASGGTLGGSLNNGSDSKVEFGGTVTVGSSTTTMNVAGREVSFTGTLTGPSNTDLTVHGTGTAVAILANVVTNFNNMTADNAGIAFVGASSLPAGSIQALNGGYIGVGNVSNTGPSVSAFLAKITSPASFNGTIGFDSGDDAAPHVFTDAINLASGGFVSGNVKLGTVSSAVLSGAITPVAQSYDFAGFGNHSGALFLQSNLGDHNILATSVTIASPNSNGAASGGTVIIFQGTNTFTGNLTVSKSSAVFDSAGAFPSGSSFSLGANSYVSYTEAATNFGTFSNFASHLLSGYTSTSILGLDSHGILSDFLAGSGNSALRTVNNASIGSIDLSGFNPLFLGTSTGVTIASDVTIKAPNDGALRLVNFGNGGDFTINPVLATGNVTSLVVGMSGAEGAVVLNAANTFTGGTTLQGGAVRLGNNNALGSGAITVSSTSVFGGGDDAAALGAASGPITLTNNIAVTNFLRVGTGDYDDNGNFTAGTTNLTLNGVISGAGGRLYITGPTTLSGANTYGGGTYVEANTLVTTDGGLGTFFVDMGYNATLTFSSSNPTIGSVSDASNFIFGAGTGNIALGSGTLNINGSSSGTFSGVISGSGGLTRSGTGFQTLSGTNTFTGVTTLSGGTMSVSTINDGGVAGNLGAASTAAANLVFDGGTLQYTGSTASTNRNFTINAGKTAFIGINNGSATLTMSGASTATNGALTKSGGGTLILSGANLHSGATSLNGGQLFVTGSLPNSAVTVGFGSTLGGTGTLGGGASINSGGHVAPGVAGVGTMTFTNGLTLVTGAILDFQLGTSSDKIFVTGGTLTGTSGTSGTTLNLSNSGGYAAGTYTLFDFAGASTSSFDLADFAVGTTIPGFSSNLSFSGSTLVLTASAIPEPATYAALVGAIALAATAWRRRRTSTASR